MLGWFQNFWNGMDKQAGRLSIRLDLGANIRVGPGKIALLEAIDAEGSISGAGRRLKMSYKRAWDLTEELNKSFGALLVAKSSGGSHGGGAQLTEAGKALVKHYRAIEQAAHDATETSLAAVGDLIRRPVTDSNT
jgi:molybdate transport system regulatory protein